MTNEHRAILASDRLCRQARIDALANQYIGDEDAAARWLRRANQARGQSKTSSAESRSAA